LQKFYRINGGSTQRKGVSSDIFLPDVFEYSKLREQNNPDALPWDEIQKADYTNWRYSLNLAPIKASSLNRINSSPSFTQIKKSAEWLAKENDKSYSLQLSRYLEDQKLVKQAVKEIDSLSKLKTELKIDPLQDDVKKLSYDQGKTERFNQWLKNLTTDIYLDEAIKVVDDMIVQDNLVYRNK
ncbi:MAG TPA: carboxy terminal-processing peptidase, partial [Flavitalea sp.]|nr:carboxy terminal-processing peptidase [Flavitalea sp.]